MEIRRADLSTGHASVDLPHALARKYPKAGAEWAWQYVFATPDYHVNPETGELRRHHIFDWTVQRHMKEAARAAGINKPATPHTLRHCFATPLAVQFAAITGARQAEFLPLHWPAWSTDEVRLDRAKQRKGRTRVDRIEDSTALTALRARLLAYQRSPMGPVFPNRFGNAYTAQGFASQFGKLMRAAIAAGHIGQRFNFHALRAYYATVHKNATGALPDMHASPTTTARIYERSRVAKRQAL